MLVRTAVQSGGRGETRADVCTDVREGQDVIVRERMFVLAATPEEKITCKPGKVRGESARKSKKRAHGRRKAFATRTKHVSRPVFAGVVQVNPSTVPQYASLPSRIGSFQVLETKNRGRRKRSKLLQCIVAIGFLQRHR